MHGPGNKGEDSKVKTKEISAYIARYASHPAISESRIIDVDYETKKVTWYYAPHEDDGLEEEDKKMGRQIITEDAFDFIKRLIIHIPDKHFISSDITASIRTGHPAAFLPRILWKTCPPFKNSESLSNGDL
jgi:hypothetical protein